MRNIKGKSFSSKYGLNIFTKQNLPMGFTLIELIMAIVIGSIILIPTSVVVVESLRNTFLPEYYTIASSLLEEKIEETTNLRFGAIPNDIVPISFGGAFSDYSYQVTYYYVDGDGNLNSKVAEPGDPIGTDYKRVEIAISRAGFPEVRSTTLATNN